jgi:SHS2 domain-containing protein
MKEFKMLEHEADIKFQVTGKSLNDIFINSVKAFSSYISSGLEIKRKKKIKIKIKSDDLNSLYYMFLDELIYLLDAKDFAASSAKLTVSGLILRAEIYGDSVKNYNLNHVKAATYAEMYIKKLKNNWKSQFVLDV